MKVLFLAKQTESSKKALEYLIKRKIDIMFAVIRKGDDVLASLCGEAGIRTGTEEDLINLYKKRGDCRGLSVVLLLETGKSVYNQDCRKREY